VFPDASVFWYEQIGFVLHTATALAITGLSGAAPAIDGNVKNKIIPAQVILNNMVFSFLVACFEELADSVVKLSDFDHSCGIVRKLS
jgi:hypothetical protein